MSTIAFVASILFVFFIVTPGAVHIARFTWAVLIKGPIKVYFTNKRYAREGMLASK